MGIRRCCWTYPSNIWMKCDIMDTLKFIWSNNVRLSFFPQTVILSVTLDLLESKVHVKCSYLNYFLGQALLDDIIFDHLMTLTLTRGWHRRKAWYFKIHILLLFSFFYFWENHFSHYHKKIRTPFFQGETEELHLAKSVNITTQNNDTGIFLSAMFITGTQCWIPIRMFSRQLTLCIS